MIKYSKHSGPLLELKQVFFQENDNKLAELKRIAKRYIEQPERKNCKNCDSPIRTVSFEKLGVPYILCPRCGHLNGAFEDTDAYCSYLYTDKKGEAYGANYDSKDRAAYKKRVDNIYVPKARFLKNALIELGEKPRELKFRDLGAGAGYFVAALLAEGMDNVKGFEVSETMVNLSKQILGKNFILHHELKDTPKIAQKLTSDVVSLIGVLEHLQTPRTVLDALSNNKRNRYIFLSLPLFSPCVFFEMVFPQVMPRQLSGGHTHLYTESSIDYFCEEFGLERIAEWWFGTDLVDLFRSVLIMLGKTPECLEMTGIWETYFKDSIDDMQNVLDKRKLSSEVHMLLKVK